MKYYSTFLVIVALCGMCFSAFYVSIYQTDKLNKRIANRKAQNQQKLEELEQKLKSETTIDNDFNNVQDNGEFIIGTPQEENDGSLIENSLFPSAYRPYSNQEKKYIPTELWNVILRNSTTKEEALYLAGLSLKESSWNEACIGDHHAQGSFGYFQVNKKYHYDTVNYAIPGFFDDKNLWQDPELNYQAFKIAFQSTSSQKSKWYDKAVCYNVGPDMVGPSNDRNRGQRYASKIQSFVDEFKTQIIEEIS